MKYYFKDFSRRVLFRRKATALGDFDRVGGGGGSAPEVVADHLLDISRELIERLDAGVDPQARFPVGMTPEEVRQKMRLLGFKLQEDK